MRILQVVQGLVSVLSQHEVGSVSKGVVAWGWGFHEQRGVCNFGWRELCLVAALVKALWSLALENRSVCVSVVAAVVRKNEQAQTPVRAYRCSPHLHGIQLYGLRPDALVPPYD